MDNRDIEFLKNIKFRDVEDVYRTQQIIDRLTLPDNLDDLVKKLAAYVAPHLTAGYKQTLEELAIWVRGALECPSWHWDSDQWEAASQSVKAAEKLLGNTIPGPVPQLATGLKPGDECRVKNELSVCWTTENCWSTEKLLFVGIRKDGRFVVEIEGGLTTSWPICEPIPKKKIYLKRLSEIIRMAESEECGCFHHNELIYLGNIIPWDDLIKWCGKSFTERPYIGPIIAPDAWLEER